MSDQEQIEAAIKQAEDFSRYPLIDFAAASETYTRSMISLTQLYHAPDIEERPKELLLAAMEALVTRMVNDLHPIYTEVKQ
jgi:hypothetical protein